MIEYSENARGWQRRVNAFMDEHIYPSEPVYHEQLNTGDRWQPVPIVEELKEQAKAAGLWTCSSRPVRTGPG